LEKEFKDPKIPQPPPKSSDTNPPNSPSKGENYMDELDRQMDETYFNDEEFDIVEDIEI
jgi:hypothetical protein